MFRVTLLRIAGCSAALISAAAPGGALAQSFGPQAAMVQSNYLFGSSTSALDTRGNAVGVWGGGANRRLPGGSWPNPVALALAAPIIHVAASGLATAVGTGAPGISVADTSAKGSWGKPKLLVPTSAGALVAFVMNARGDVMIVYGTRAIRRAAGTTKWGAPETVAVAPAGTSGVSLENAAIENAGEAIVTYETYTVVCGPRSCYRRAWTLGAAREAAIGLGFQPSGVITATQLPLSVSHANRVTVDPHGVAAVVYQDVDAADSSTVQLRTVTQPRAQTGWSTPAIVYALGFQSPWPLSITVDANYQASVVLLDPSDTSYHAIDGNLVSNAWSVPVTLTSSDRSALPGGVVGGNAVGGLVLGWSSVDGTIHAVLRPASGAPWGAAQTLAPVDPSCSSATPCTSINSAALNDAGNAIVTWSNFHPQNEAFAFEAATTN